MLKRRWWACRPNSESRRAAARTPGRHGSAALTGAARGMRSRPTRASCSTSSKRPTRPSKRSTRRTAMVWSRNWATCCAGRLPCADRRGVRPTFRHRRCGRGIAEKLIARHPHVFGDETAQTAGDVEAAWFERKAAREGAHVGHRRRAHGDACAALIEKLLHRAEKGGSRCRRSTRTSRRCSTNTIRGVDPGDRRRRPVTWGRRRCGGQAGGTHIARGPIRRER